MQFHFLAVTIRTVPARMRTSGKSVWKYRWRCYVWVVEISMITWKMIYKIENAFGFRLYKWQRNYLLGNRTNRTRHRRNGNTFAYCLKLLLSDGKPIEMKNHNARKYIDEWHGPSYITWFAGYLKEINDILVKNGFETRLKEK